MISIIVSLVIVAIATMILFSQRQSIQNLKQLLKQAQKRTILLEEKMDESRGELRKSKEELEREKNALREARELTKKKLRRHANAEIDLSNSQDEAAMNKNISLENNEQQKAILALETQVEELKKEKLQNEDEIRAHLSAEFSKKEEEKNAKIEESKKKITELQEEIKKQKRLMRPEGIKVDLKTLPDEAACEFARVYRKAEQHERLHGIARAKLHLAQEKFTELQKRYFSVCRELAVLAGGQENLEPLAAREMAEKIVADSQGISGEQIEPSNEPGNKLNIKSDNQPGVVEESKS
jgi:DNA repair exonuclease SbcCD ATPase subunit